MSRLNDFIAFNEELLALVRLGVPLRLGLGRVDRETDTALAKINASVGVEISQGQTLTAALESQSESFPPLYCDLVKAGLRAGRLPAALEALIGYLRRTAEIRQRLGRALVYPLTVCVIAYALLVWLLYYMTPIVEEAYAAFRVSAGGGLSVLRSLAGLPPMWLMVPPLLVAGIVFFASRYAKAHHPLRPVAWWQPSLSAIPGLRAIARDYRHANLAELLALMVENNVALSDGLVLAADTTGDKRLRRTARALAEAMDDGAQLTSDLPHMAGLPPLLRWSLSSSSDQSALSSSLRVASEAYHRVGDRKAERLQAVTPLAACVLIGGGATLCYVLLLTLPLFQLLTKLAAA